MDPIRLRVLEAEVTAQLAEIEQIYETLENRASQMRPESPIPIESTAYQLHNLYNAVEDLLKIVANTFENHITDLSQWHTELLRRMTLQISGVRPALLSTETAGLLNELRAFRHFFRHAYNVRLDFRRVDQNLDVARKVRPLLPRDVTAFLQALGLS
jgi:hypothetical protein